LLLRCLLVFGIVYDKTYRSLVFGLVFGNGGGG
jgi:hypothetical protein